MGFYLRTSLNWRWPLKIWDLGVKWIRIHCWRDMVIWSFIMWQRKLYYICVKSVHIGQLQGRPDTKWRDNIDFCEGVHPSWRVFYKPPVSKRCGDLQWRVLHCAIASNSLVSKFNETVLLCPFFNAHDTVFHMFFECSRLGSLVQVQVQVELYCHSTTCVDI